METFAYAVFGIAVTVLGILVYWVPTIVGAVSHKHNLGPVIVVSLFLGWTFLGWVVALAMAVSKSERS